MLMVQLEHDVVYQEITTQTERQLSTAHGFEPAPVGVQGSSYNHYTTGYF